jgi:hypothetical protein
MSAGRLGVTGGDCLPGWKDGLGRAVITGISEARNTGADRG